MTILKNRRFVTFIMGGFVLLNCVLALFLFRRIYRTYPKPAKTPTTISYFLNRQQYFEVFPKDTNSIVFLGNSLTQNFEVTELLKDLRIKNRGIYGDFTAGVINRIEPIIQSHPKKVFIEIGLNDLLHNIPKDTILKNYKTLIDTLQSGNSGTKVYVQSLLPVGDNYETANLPDINDDIRYINAELKQYALTHQASYINLHDRFALNGKINPKYFISDNEHISGEGYLLWAELVKPFVSQ